MQNEKWKYEVKLGLIYLTEYLGENTDVLEIPKKIDKRIVYSVEPFCFVGKTFGKIIVPAIYYLKDDAFSGCEFKELIMGNVEDFNKITDLEENFALITDVKKVAESIKETFKNVTICCSKVWKYDTLEDGTIRLIKYSGTDTSCLKVPDMIDGKIVSAMSGQIFNNKKVRLSLRCIKLPKNMKEIEDYLFSDMKRLSKIETEGIIEVVGKKAFEYSLLSDFSFLEKAKIIKSEAFYKTNMKDFTSETLEEVSSYAFYQSSVEKIVLKNENLKLNKYSFFGCDYLAEVSLPKTITVLPNGCFKSCSSLTKVKPSTFKEIGEQVFCYCSKLCLDDIFNGLENHEFSDEDFIATRFKELVIRKGMKLARKTFKSSKIQKLTFEEDYDMDEIPFSCFAYVSELKDVLLPKSIKRLADYAFHYSTIEKINLENVEEIGQLAFENTALTKVTLSKKLKVLTDCFRHTSYLEEINIPEDAELEVIEERALEGVAIKSLKLPKNLKAIEREAFSYCAIENIEINGDVVVGPAAFVNSKLKEVVWNTISNIPNYAFKYARSLESIKITKPIKSIGQDAFCACENLKEIKLPDSITTLERGVFEKTGLVRIDIPFKVKTLEYFLFRYCKNLEYVKTPFCLEEIKTSAFNGCSSLKNIEFPDTLKSIGTSAFSGSGLITIKFPEIMSIIEDNAFNNVRNLEKVVLPSEIRKIGLYNFETNCKSTVLFTAKNKKVFSKLSSRKYFKDNKGKIIFEKIK